VGGRHGRDAVRLTVLGSGSRGNALLLESGADALLVDAGFSLRDLTRRLAAAGRDPARVLGIVLTHEHGDHARGAPGAAAAWRVPLLASAGTLAALGPRLKDGTETRALEAGRPRRCGAFAVRAFPTAHDAADAVMVVVEDGEGRRVGVACDVGTPTTALRHACQGLDALVLETNHDEVLLRSSAYPPAVRARIAGRGGHLSNREAGLLAAEVAHAGLAVVVLAHLSDRCNTPDLARDTVAAALRGTAFRGARGRRPLRGRAGARACPRSAAGRRATPAGAPTPTSS
jgi:phosphoribosyl 1,2-cyclic phosphodiesterase